MLHEPINYLKWSLAFLILPIVFGQKQITK